MSEEPTPEEIALASNMPPAKEKPKAGKPERARADSKPIYLPDIHRMLPQNSEAELGVLSAFVLSPTEVAAMVARLRITPAHFHIPAHRVVFEALVEMQAQLKPIEFITLSAALRAQGRFDAVGGASFVTSLWTYLATATNAEYYLGMLQQCFVARQMVQIGEKYAGLAYEERETERIAELLHDFHAEVGALIYRPNRRVTIAEDMADILHTVEHGKDETGLLRTGMPGMDNEIALLRGDCLVIAGPTSSGKTALAAQIGLHIASRTIETEGRPPRKARVAIYPLEMKQSQTLKRALSQLGHYNPDFVRKAIITSKQKEIFGDSTGPMLAALKETAAEVLSLDLHIRDDLHFWEEIESDLRAEHANRPFDYVLIDYLQLVKVRKKFDLRYQEIAHITQGSKKLAKDLDCILCLPSQVNEDGSTREGKDAQNDASQLLQIAVAEDDQGKRRPTTVTSWKVRDGEPSLVLPLRFNGRLTRWEAYDRAAQD